MWMPTYVSMCCWLCCSCLFEHIPEAQTCGGLPHRVWGVRQSGRAQKGRHRIEKEDISLELVTVGRGWAPIQLAWRLYQGMCVTEAWVGPSLRCSLRKQSREASRCDLPHGECCGISTPPWHVFSFPAKETTLLLMLCVCFDICVVLFGQRCVFAFVDYILNDIKNILF